MAYSARLVNATPLPVEWNYHRGVVLKIPAFGHMDIPSQIMEQFMPDQPGYDGVKQELDHFGLFLKDSSKPYEMQAVEALSASIKAKTRLYNDCEKATRKRAADSGNLKEDAIQAEMERSGYTRLKAEIDQMQAVLNVLNESNAKNKRTMHEQYDPDRTLLFMNPPQVFDSPLAMRLFLSLPENKDLAEQQAAFMAKMTKKVEKPVKVDA